MKKLLALLVLVLSFTAVANAEVMSLKEAIKVALKENPQVKAYTWALEAEKEQALTVKSRYFPKLTVEERFMRTDSPTYAFMAKLNQERFSQSDFMIDSINNPDAINDFQTTLSFQQPVFVPRLIEGIKIARKSVESSSLKLKHIQEKVTRDVMKSYLSVLIAKQYVDVARKAIDDIKEHKRLAEVRYKTGFGLYSDVLRAEVALKDAEKRFLAAQNGLDTSKRMLALVLGRTEPVDVTQSDIDLTLKEVKYYILASEDRSDLRSLKKALDMAREAVKLEQSTFLPEVGIGGSYQLNDHNTPFGSEGHSYNIMAFLRWNFLDFTRKHMTHRASLKAMELSENIEGLKKQIVFNINRAYNDVVVKKKNIELYEAAVRDAEEAVRLVQARYKNSLSPIVDLLDTQLMLDQSRAKLIEAKKQYQMALIDLYFESGILYKEVENEILK